jgi:hypothetical protein
MAFDKCLLAAANQAAGTVHSGTKNSFPRAGGLKRSKRAFLGDGACEASSSLRSRQRSRETEEARSRGQFWPFRRRRFGGEHGFAGEVAKAKSLAISGGFELRAWGRRGRQHQHFVGFSRFVDINSLSRCFSRHSCTLRHQLALSFHAPAVAICSLVLAPQQPRLALSFLRFSGSTLASNFVVAFSKVFPFLFILACGVSALTCWLGSNQLERHASCTD